MRTVQILDQTGLLLPMLTKSSLGTHIILFFCHLLTENTMERPIDWVCILMTALFQGKFFEIPFPAEG